MKDIRQLRNQLARGEFDFSRHAFLRAVERDISDHEIREAGGRAEIIESYPDDKYSPSVLLLGFTGIGKPLHLQVSCAPSARARLITLYVPDPAMWEDFRRRR
jgi:hypothetical protein